MAPLGVVLRLHTVMGHQMEKNMEFEVESVMGTWLYRDFVGIIANITVLGSLHDHRIGYLKLTST